MEDGFWWNWVVNLAIAVGTIGAVCVALFGRKISHFLQPPKLEIFLKSEKGEKTPVIINEQGRGLATIGLYFHVSVENNRRYSVANNVRVFLLSVKEEDDSGIIKSQWSGEVPLRWRHEEHISGYRNMGPGYDADLFSCVKGRGIQILPCFFPLGLTPEYKSAVSIKLSVQAKSIEVDSDIIDIIVTWNGMWSDSGDKMKEYLKVYMDRRNG